MNIPSIITIMKNTNLRSKAKLLEPVLRIGKSGITENQIIEINRLLKKKKLIKVKILKSMAKDKDKIIKEILNNTNSTLIEKVGNVFVLYKK